MTLEEYSRAVQPLLAEQNELRRALQISFDNQSFDQSGDRFKENKRSLNIEITEAKLIKVQNKIQAMRLEYINSPDGVAK